MILTKEFLEQAGACEEGVDACIFNDYIGMEYDEVLKEFLRTGQRDFAGWLLEQKSTELYVRQNGKVFSMGAYQIFNPLTGIHLRAETEEEAKTVFLDVIRSIADHYAPTVVRELRNENGDAAWVLTDLKQVLMQQLTITDHAS